MKVQEYQEKKGKNSHMLTKENYVATVSRLKQLEKPGEQRTLTDNNLMRRFALLHVASGNNIIEKLVKPGTSNLFVPIEEFFNKIHDAHIEKGHPGRDIMQKYLATKYANVTTEQINIYRSFCETCALKKSKARRGVVVKPILTQNVMSRGQVDLIDMQSQPDGEFKFILNYQDHFCKFCVLRPLKHKTVSSVAKVQMVL